MRVSVSSGSFSILAREIEGDIARSATGAMRATIGPTKDELRAQIVSAGLGARLANTWRGKVYPTSRQSVTPAGYIWSNAPDIIESYVGGTTIVPINGARYLAIPTKSVPRRRGRGRATSTKRMSPAEVEHEFNQDLVILKGKAGRLLGFVAKDLGRTRGQGFRKVRKGRRGHGVGQELLLMFTFVKSVRMPKLLDLKTPADRWTGTFEAEFAQRLASS